MGKAVCMTGLCSCSQGVATVPLMVIPANKVMINNMPAATVKDHMPFVNVMTFGMCQSMSNPMVIAATAAALGVKTPAPCIPLTTDPWSPGSPTVKIGGNPALTDSSKLKCKWGGSIALKSAGQQTVQVP